MGRLSEPGPGFMPFWLGVVTTCLALYKLAKESLSKGEEENADSKTVKAARWSSPLGKLIFISVTLFVYALLLEWLGYILTTFLTMILLLRGSGYIQWTRIVVYAVIIVSVSYVMFLYLGVRFPAGVLSYFGLY
jgi:putative tricarboxylic transport membrane protein